MTIEDIDFEVYHNGQEWVAFAWAKGHIVAEGGMGETPIVAIMEAEMFARKALK